MTTPAAANEMERGKLPDPKKLAVGAEPDRPVSIYDTETGDVLAYIPNGKTKIAQGAECDECRDHDLGVAHTIVFALRQLSADLAAEPANEMERRAFAAWFVENTPHGDDPFRLDDDGSYYYTNTDNAWLAWQFARAEQAQEMAALRERLVRVRDVGIARFLAAEHEAERLRKQARELNSAGYELTSRLVQIGVVGEIHGAPKLSAARAQWSLLCVGGSLLTRPIATPPLQRGARRERSESRAHRSGKRVPCGCSVVR